MKEKIIKLDSLNYKYSWGNSRANSRESFA